MDTATSTASSTDIHAAAERAFVKEPRFEALPVGAIAPSNTRAQQLRRSLFSDAEIEELGASIKRIGLAQPIVVRLAPKPNGFVIYELVAGEKRWLASQRADLPLIQCVVRDLTDDEVLELQLAENIQRDTIHPLVEATGYQEMIEMRQLTVEQVAEQVSKSKAWVYNRLKLLEIDGEARDAFLRNEIPTTVALLIARIPNAELRTRAFAKVQAGNDPSKREPMSFRDAQAYIQAHFMRELRGVTFKLEDATLLPAAGDCMGCPKRSGNQKDLFNDVSNPNLCTDPKCLEAKTEAQALRERTAREAAGEKIIAGKEARRIRPSADAKLKGFVDVDAEMTIGDGSIVKPAEALGDALPATQLFEDPFNHRLHRVVDEKALAQALADKGLAVKHKTYDATQKKKAEDKARLESAVRFRLLREIREKPPAAADMVPIAQWMWEQLSFDLQKRLVDSRNGSAPAAGKSTDYVGAFGRKIASLTPPELAVLTRDISLVGYCHVTTASKPDPTALFAAAKRLGIKEDKVREAVEAENTTKPAEGKAKRKAGKK